MRPEHPLADIERNLAVSPRHRLDLLEEVDADVEALQAELERRGYGPAQARRAALRQVVPRTETLAQLEAQHAPRLGRWARTAGWLDRLQRLGVAAAAILAGGIATLAIRWSGTPAVTAELAWLQVIVIALLAGNWTLAAKRLWIDGDLRPELRRQLWERQIGLIVAAVALGALGAAWESYAAYEAIEAEDFAGPAIWDAVRRIVSSAALGFGAAIFGLFGWLAITPRLISDETIERHISTFFAGSRLTPTTSTRR